MIRHNFARVSKGFITLDDIRVFSPHPDISDFEGQYKQQSNLGVPLIKTHLPPNYLDSGLRPSQLILLDKILKDSRVIYVVRDGRDVMTSLYYYMRTFDEQIRMTDFSRFLRQDAGYGNGMNRPEFWAYHVSEWIPKADLVIRYEDLSKDYRMVVKSISEDLCLDINDKIMPIPFSCRKSKVRRITERFVPFFAGLSSSVLPRKGVVGDWRNEFNASDEEFFWSRAGHVMKALSY